MTLSEPPPITLPDLRMCFEGAVPAVIATASAGGVPNITHLSRVHLVDGERIALSNQFFSKTSRNLAENPRASVLLVDPTSMEQYRLDVAYERTERRGPVFEQLREDVDAIAALQGMQDVFKLRAADIYRVVRIEHVRAAVHQEHTGAEPTTEERLDAIGATSRLAELSARLSRCPDLDTLVSATVDGVCDTLGYEHVLLLLLDESGARLFTIASSGYEEQGVGSEVAMGDGVIGMAAARCVPMRAGNLGMVRKYSRNVRRAFEAQGVSPGREVPVPGLADARSQIAVPAMALGELVGVLVIESPNPVAFDDGDVAILTALAGTVAGAIENARAREQDDDRVDRTAAVTASQATAATTHVRFFAVDGSTFVDGDYLIKGVAGRILWSLLGHYEREQRVEFTNKEVRLDPTLELPEFKDNLESRLILLKRRLEERDAPMRLTKTGRGRFRLDVDTTLSLEAVDAPER
jgi:predicted pyridoxine 5'-phosphate oxidase superfamily flavin-nucleotide-binding protein